MIMFKRSCEDKSTVYLCLLPCLRLIFREGKFVGWYNPRMGEAV